jgi:hypothetical protein
VKKTALLAAAFVAAAFPALAESQRHITQGQVMRWAAANETQANRRNFMAMYKTYTGRKFDGAALQAMVMIASAAAVELDAASSLASQQVHMSHAIAVTMGTATNFVSKHGHMKTPNRNSTKPGCH